MESVIVNPKTVLPDLCSVWLWEWRKTRVMTRSRGLLISVGGAQHWSSMKRHSPLSVIVEKLAPSKCFCVPPAPASSFRCYKGRLLTPGVQVWWRMRVLHTIWLSSWLMASEKEERSAHLVTLGTDVLQRTGSCQPHFLFLKFIVQCKVVIRMTSVRMCPIN